MRHLKTQIGNMGVVVCVAVAILPPAASAGESQAGRPNNAGASARNIKHDEPTCVRAKAWSGKRPGAINVRVLCRARKRSSVQFSVNVFSRPRAGRHSLLRNFRRRPEVFGRGQVRRFGICRESSQTLDCRAVAKGEVRIQGRLWVKPKERCQAEVRVFVAKPAECESRECEGVFRVKYLYKDRPRGC